MSDVKLRREVYRDDIKKLIKWMGNPMVTKYLNELPFIKDALEKLLVDNTCDVFTHFVNSKGHFYMVDKVDEGKAIGYARLVQNGNEGEVVIAIGDTDKWGKGLGKKTLWKLISISFFDLRLKKLNAKINHFNKRSKRVFKKLGFNSKKDLGKEQLFVLSRDKFIEEIC